LRKLRRIYLSDSHPPAEQKLIETFRASAGDVEFITGRSFEEMTRNSDIICTATRFTTTPSCLIKAEWVQQGQTYLPQESFSVVDPRIGQICDRFITDSIDEARLFDSMGYFPLGLPPVDCETGEMLAGLQPGRVTKDQIIVCNNIGMSVCDLAVARLIYDNALAQDAGTVLEL
jgi:ornithine cyclodeaminase/alanine dehydrogenase